MTSPELEAAKAAIEAYNDEIREIIKDTGLTETGSYLTGIALPIDMAGLVHDDIARQLEFHGWWDEGQQVRRTIVRRAKLQEDFEAAESACCDKQREIWVSAKKEDSRATMLEDGTVIIPASPETKSLWQRFCDWWCFR